MTFHSHAIHCSHFCATTASPEAYYGLYGYSGLATASGAIYGGASTSLGSSAAAPVYGYNTPQTPPVTAIASALLKKGRIFLLPWTTVYLWTCHQNFLPQC